MSDEHSEFDDVVDATVEQVAYHAQRMDKLLETLQGRLAQNYTHVPMAIGACMIAGGFLHIWLRGEFAFSLIAMVWGSIIISLALFFHNRVGQNLVVFGQSLTEIDKDRNEHARKLAVIEHLFKQGVPGGMSLHHLLVLLGESPEGKSHGDLGSNGSRPENN
ncbi:MAG: hypothetical protein QGG64_00450 [Candidatus Latescibacteria bacterium]|jgi:hypothetical protein|nr:hypothetical protein [Candidatus Latescibacterota bacterium]